MADQFVQVGPDSTGKKIDTEEQTVGANTVERQRVVTMNSLVPRSFDYVSLSTTSTTDTYTYKLGGSGGTTVRTVVVTWTTTSKNVLSSVSST